MKNLQEKRQRLRWQCRRGMLELDLILQDFFDKNYLTLVPDDQDLFERLLTYPDQELYSYLIKRQPMTDRAMQALMERISCGG
ncbi:succinate dehydrogenase assembly factor 2 [Rickettsiella endosymbiont of Litargus connexus]|jgi:antitoxin CptB|uniref:FAD assembly factor SdhE n=1 Tax=Rickettsiella endosymbiont of Litargus connexus TaxID=3066237 RepID=UPI0027FD3D71|nr:succinate dehydrogenase assembly factor 2 [Gammaproteobacteria bacterium]MCH9754979.1 succinate dehydrogenase assembly factor 2 [Gammaproteobacteria bacterium]MDD5161720.1 succinate dehydrogenase assembly factor 2 [Candidatus Rickettsiella isopodorum]MDQ5899291.1 antitoxin CptB [Pseudomonadota bacterium]